MRDENRVEIGARLRSARQDAGLTQKQLAGMLGVTTRTIQNYEAGATVPHRHLRQIETITRRHAVWLLDGQDDGYAFDSALATLHEAFERHSALLHAQLEQLTQNVERLKELRAEREERRRADGRGTPTDGAAPHGR